MSVDEIERFARDRRLLEIGHELTERELVPYPRRFREKTSTIVEHPSWQAGSSILIDERGLDLGNIGTPDVRMLADGVRKLNDRLGSAKMAIVTGSGLQFGIARQFEAMVSHRATVEVGVFKEPETASERLGLPA